MNASRFYADKAVTSVEWWLHQCDLPSLRWARLRVFSDGTADATWEDGGTRYGFGSREFAGFFIAGDEYIRLSDMDNEDEAEHGILMSEIVPPAWTDADAQPFEYLGSY